MAASADRSPAPMVAREIPGWPQSLQLARAQSFGAGRDIDVADRSVMQSISRRMDS